MQPSLADSRARTAIAHWRPELLILLAAALVPVVAAPLNTDTGYILVAGRRLLQGQQLYVDLIETNPPLIFWMGALQVWAAQALSIGDAGLMGWYVALLLVAAGLPAVRLLSRDADSRLLAATIMAVFLFAVIAPYVSWIGQREQIAAILTLPYVLLAARAAAGRESPRGLSLWCGALAGVGLAIKPFFLASWLALELLVLLCTRRWRSLLRPETLAVVVMQIAYVAAVMVLTPAYLADAVPMAFQLYGAYGKSVARIVSAWRFPLLVGIGAVAVITARYTRVPGSVRYAPAFGAATCGWVLSYLAQGKGWPYHLLPAVAYGSVAVAATAGETFLALRDWRLHSSWQRTFAALTTVFVGACLVAVVPRIPGVLKDAWTILRLQQQGAVMDMVQYVESAATGEPIYFLSTSMWPAFPVVNMARAEWPYRYHFLWPIPALYATGSSSVPTYRAPDAQSAVERRFFDTVIEDLIRTPPRVLVVDRRADLQAMHGQRFDFVEYFSGSAEFRALLARYRRIGFIGPWEVFERF